MRRARLGQLIVTCALAIGALIPASSTAAKAGHLDQRFGDHGVVISKSNVETHASVSTADGALEPDGAIVLAGAFDSGQVAKYEQNGTRDTAFGNGGQATFGHGSASAVALQSDGKIVVAGEMPAGTITRSVLVRLNPSGSLDTSFGDGGITDTPGGTGESLALQKDGKIVVAEDGESDELRVARFNPDGSLDSGFGNGGLASTNAGAKPFVDTVLVEADGHIVLVGGNRPGGGVAARVVVARYMPNGSADTSFGTNGLATVTPSDFLGFREIEAAALQPDGRVLVATVGFNGFDLTRFQANGSLDGTFGSGGVVKTPITRAVTAHLAVEGSGRILFAGGVTPAAANGFLERFDSSGAADPTFGAGGRVSIGSEEVAFVGSDASGRTVAAGSIPNFICEPEFCDQDEPEAISIERFDTAGRLDPTFGHGGAITDYGATSQGPAIYSYAFGLLAQPHGRVLVAGESSDYGGASATLTRFRAGGSRDSSFGMNRSGQVVARVLKTSDGESLVRSVLTVLPRSHGRSVLVARATPAIATGSSFVLLGFTANGSLDPSFGEGGIATTVFGADDAQVTAATTQEDGRILVGGVVGGQVTVARYNANASLDTGFGENGLITSSSLATVAAMLVDSSGRIVLAGQLPSGESAVVGVLSDGTVDPSFGDSGVRTIEFGSQGKVNGLLGLADDRILAYGSEGRHVALERLTRDGDVDAGFDRRARQVSSLGSFQFPTGSLDGAGKIVIAGTALNKRSGYHFALIRCKSNGSLDRSFGSDGFASSRVRGFSSAVSVAGDRITVAGNRELGSTPSSDHSVAIIARFVG